MQFLNLVKKQLLFDTRMSPGSCRRKSVDFAWDPEDREEPLPEWQYLS
jgi:hypothetical protein